MRRLLLAPLVIVAVPACASLIGVDDRTAAPDGSVVVCDGVHDAEAGAEAEVGTEAGEGGETSD